MSYSSNAINLDGNWVLGLNERIKGMGVVSLHHSSLRMWSAQQHNMTYNNTSTTRGTHSVVLTQPIETQIEPHERCIKVITGGELVCI